MYLAKIASVTCFTLSLFVEHLLIHLGSLSPGDKQLGKLDDVSVVREITQLLGKSIQVFFGKHDELSENETIYDASEIGRVSRF